MLSQRLVSALHVSLLALGLLMTGACSSTAPSMDTDGSPHAHEEAAPKLDRAAWRARLAKARDAHVAALREYVGKGVFPVNAALPRTANVFRDAAGHLCAVANLIHLDGRDDLVDRTAKSNNLVILADERSGDLVEWISTSGFLREEIAQIQGPYMALPPREDDKAAFLPKERARIVTRLTSVLEQLDRDREASLDEAVTRLLVKRGQAA